MKFGIIYSGEQLEPRAFRGFLHVASVESIFEITRLVDASATPDDSQRVERVAKFLRLVPEKPESRLDSLDLKSVDAWIVEIGPNPQKSLQIAALLPELVDKAGVHVHLPYNLLTGIPYVEIIDLFARAASQGVVLLACSRFLFGECFTRFKAHLNSVEFGGVRDANFRIGIGPVPSRKSLLTFGMHHLNIIFDVFPEKPVGLSVVASENPRQQPSVNFTMRFEQGEIANFFLSANRLWGATSYHWIEVSGRNAYAATDLMTRRYRTGIDPDTRVSDLSDDDQGPVIFGPAGKLRFFAAAASRSDVSSIENFSKITKRSLWVYWTLDNMLKDAPAGMANRSFSTGAPDGWPK